MGLPYKNADYFSIEEVQNLNVTGQIQLNGLSGNAGDVLTSNGTNDPTFNTPLTKILIGAHLSTNNTVGSNAQYLVIKYNVVDFDFTGSYTAATGVFKAPRDGYYNISAFARVADFSVPNANRVLFNIEKKVDGTFVKYAESDNVDIETNIKMLTGSINLIVKLLINEEIRTTTTMDGGGGFGLRGSDFGSGVRMTCLSITNVD